MNDVQRLTRGYALNLLHDGWVSCRTAGLSVEAENHNGTLVLRVSPAWVIYNSDEESFVPVEDEDE